MGKGLALQFKQNYPYNYQLYAEGCAKGKISIGKMFVTEVNGNTNHRFIINFPTKAHWKAPSTIDYITKGLEDFIVQIKKLQITSVAIPQLGCGLGGLAWTD